MHSNFNSMADYGGNRFVRVFTCWEQAPILWCHLPQLNERLRWYCCRLWQDQFRLKLWRWPSVSSVWAEPTGSCWAQLRWDRTGSLQWDRKELNFTETPQQVRMWWLTEPQGDTMIVPRPFHRNKVPARHGVQVLCCACFQVEPSKQLGLGQNL